MCSHHYPSFSRTLSNGGLKHGTKEHGDSIHATSGDSPCPCNFSRLIGKTQILLHRSGHVFCVMKN